MPVQGSAEEQKYWQWRVEKEEREALEEGLRRNPNPNPNRNYHVSTLGVPMPIANRPTTSEFAVARGSVGTASTVEGSLAGFSVASSRRSVRSASGARRGGDVAAMGKGGDVDLRSVMSQRTAQSVPRSKGGSQSARVGGSRAAAAMRAAQGAPAAPSAGGVSDTSSAVMRRLSLLENALERETIRRVQMEKEMARFGATHRGPVPSSQRPRALGFKEFGVDEGEPDTGKALGFCNPSLNPELYNPLKVVGGGDYLHGRSRKKPVKWATARPTTAPMPFTRR